jgi:hypothetical protein
MLLRFVFLIDKNAVIECLKIDLEIIKKMNTVNYVLNLLIQRKWRLQAVGKLSFLNRPGLVLAGNT